MTRFRLLVIALLVLAIGSCQLIKNENFISFTLDGTQYVFTASAPSESNPWAIDHPCAVGYFWGSNPPNEYVITGSATAEDAAAIPNPKNTIVIDIGNDGDWYATATIWNSDGESMWLFMSQIPAGMIDTFITNRDEVGEQFAGSMPGPFGESSELKNIVFSVERLPNEE
jgi:hypothetical protein